MRDFGRCCVEGAGCRLRGTRHANPLPEALPREGASW